MSIISIQVPAIQAALFPVRGEGQTVKVYGVESPVLFTGSLQAADKKDGDRWVPSAYGRLSVRAAKASSREGKEYLALVIDGGLQGRLYKAEPGKDYEYVGSIDAGNGEEFVVFGRRRKSEAGAFIAINSAERKAREATPPKSESAHSAVPDDDIPF